MRIKKIAENLIKKYNTNDPFHLAEYMNVAIHEIPMHEEIMGFYKYSRRNQFIVLNANLKLYLKKFTCAHELSHSVLHPRANTPFLRSNTLYPVGKIEKEANKLAVELLLPDTSIYNYQDTNMTINEIGSIYGIPNEVLHLKKIYP
ncbi:ImmA/IrrE family metallo-endopeptidase [Ornithinibacillus sp. 4-3]|uniref:ImmA/IrrE family metallo-endopeptidase n=1 Tax=Ornithinibacillus sp. 4-3 TaxID=3231488 RepID=A0AB39HN45_9BACI